MEQVLGARSWAGGDGMQGRAPTGVAPWFHSSLAPHLERQEQVGVVVACGSFCVFKSASTRNEYIGV